MKCQKCGSRNEDGAWVCRTCEYILDSSFLGNDILNERTRDGVVDESASEESPLHDFGDDALILGRLGDGEVEEFVTDRTGGFLPKNSEEKKKAPRSVYLTGEVRMLLVPDVILRHTPDAAERREVLSPDEIVLFDLIDGERTLAELQEDSAFSDNDLCVTVAMLHDKALVERAPRVDDSTRELEVLPPLAEPPGEDPLPASPFDEPSAAAAPAQPAPSPAPPSAAPPLPSPARPMPSAAPPLPARPSPAPPLPSAAPPLPSPAPPLPSAAPPLPSPARPLPSPARPLPSPARPLPSPARPLPSPARPLPSPARPLPSPAPEAAPPLEPSPPPGSRFRPALRPAMKAAPLPKRSPPLASPARTGAPASPPPTSAPSESASTREAKKRAANYYDMCMKELGFGRMGRAWGYAKMAADADPSEEKYAALLRDWNKLHGAHAERASTPQELMAAAKEAEANGDFEKAVDLLKKLVAQAPGAAAAHNMLAVLLATRLRDFRAAYDAAIKAVELEPGNMAYQSNMMKILSRIENDEGKGAATGGAGAAGGILSRLLRRS